MKKIFFSLLIGMIVFSNISIVDASSVTGAFYQLNHELKRIDSDHVDIQFEVVNTTSKTINNVILDFSLKETKNNYPKSGFVFLGQIEPNVPAIGIVSFDAPFQIEESDMHAHVLQNADFQLSKNTIYPLNYFNGLVEIADAPLIMRSGVAVWSGKITNKSAIPLKFVCFYVDYADQDGNVFKTLFQKWGSLNIGETKSYSFSNLISKEFKRSGLNIMPIEPGYENGK